MTKRPWWWRVLRWDPARVEAVRALFAVSRYCTETANDPKYRGWMTRQWVAHELQRCPWIIREYVLPVPEPPLLTAHVLVGVVCGVVVVGLAFIVTLVRHL